MSDPHQLKGDTGYAPFSCSQVTGPGVKLDRHRDYYYNLCGTAFPKKLPGIIFIVCPLRRASSQTVEWDPILETGGGVQTFHGRIEHRVASFICKLTFLPSLGHNTQSRFPFTDYVFMPANSKWPKRRIVALP